MTVLFTTGQTHVVGAFPREREALRTMAVLSASPELGARYLMHPVVGERGDTEMVLLEIGVPDGTDLARVERAVIACHGIPVSASIVPGLRDPIRG